MAVLEKSPVAAASAPAAPCTNVSLFKPFLFRRETICVNVSLHRVRILQGTATKQQKSSAPVDQDDDDEDDDFDLFGSDEDDTEAEKIKQQRVTEYAARKAKKPALIAKSSILLDVKPVRRRLPFRTHIASRVGLSCSMDCSFCDP